MMLMILLGAPMTSQLPNTLLCAAHLSILAGLPLVYVHGVSAESWRRVLGLMVPVDEIVGSAVGVVVGAWLGAVPIPLDW